jgi:hypothetical protein
MIMVLRVNKFSKILTDGYLAYNTGEGLQKAGPSMPPAEVFSHLTEFPGTQIRYLEY